MSTLKNLESGLKEYLGIDDYKIGPPPNWRHDQYWKRRLFRKKFNYKLYICDVESFIKKAHQRHWEDICALDELSGERGSASEIMVRDMKEALFHLNNVKQQIEKWADKWRLTEGEYDEKWK